MKKRWLITGGCGFIGSTLIRRLLSTNTEIYQIRVVDNFSTGTIEDLQVFCKPDLIDENGAVSGWEQGVKVIKGDIGDSRLAKILAEGADVIVHLAANTGVQPSIQNPVLDMQSNVIGVVNYLEAARNSGGASFVLASSGAPIGEAEPPIHEMLPCRPISPYGASKLAGEAYCSAYHGSYGLKTVALRFSNVYGPMSGKKGSVVAKLFNLVLDGKPWVVNGTGEQTRDFIFSEDLVDAIILAVEADKGGKLYQVATEVETSILELISLMTPLAKDVLGIQPVVNYGEPLVGDVARNYSCTSLIKSELGWIPRVQLTQGLGIVAKWFAANKRI